jgi:glycosyltransferase involved in cell wall biosynthesis
MNWLFIHQNFPAQYVHIARHLAGRGDAVCFITQQRDRELPGVRKIVYVPRRQASKVHPFVREFEASIENGLAVAQVCEGLKREGFRPDMVIGHNGWGETLYVKDVWPETILLSYFEFFYHAADSDLDFDPEFPPSPLDRVRIRTRNVVNLLGLETADWGQTPTEWQKSLYPERYWPQISVIHEGVDTALVRPDPSARLWLRGRPLLAPGQQIVTYSARNLEPYRGFHVFMRALPPLLARFPDLQVLIVGGNGVSYGRRPAQGTSWREAMLSELGGRLDLGRVHFLGRLPYPQYLAALQVSAAHVYFTYPFVLSWSFLEAMAAGCLLVASKTPPVEEVVRDGENGYLVDFFDRDALVERLSAALTRPDRDARIRAAARATVEARYDLKSVCLPAYLALLDRLLQRPARREAAARQRTG